MKAAVLDRIGFMQGRLSPQIDGKIQAFPWPYWRDEFAGANELGLGCIEWTLDHARLSENPLMTGDGRAAIRELATAHRIVVSSLTGDCFMQAPFWKAHRVDRIALIDELRAVLQASASVGITIVVVPLVDNGSLADRADRDSLESGLAEITPLLRRLQMWIAFESDFAPHELAEFIAGFPADCYGINFDIGNSASLGWDPAEEIAAIGSRIVNVHVKDRLRGGSTVALGEGSADLPRVFELLRSIGYGGRYILQTARAADGDHAGAIKRYRDRVAGLIRG